MQLYGGNNLMTVNSLLMTTVLQFSPERHFRQISILVIVMRCARKTGKYHMDSSACRSKAFPQSEQTYTYQSETKLENVFKNKIFQAKKIVLHKNIIGTKQTMHY